ncbi:hypothetical protein AVEN_275508-1 [Araneus ventricosus]|uniref:Endonuclease/exonuclease/phosphatase domain-containing protein n=1 Tax=Araneus ventricosus TaxID=182803 RepID=A0A4Y2QY24_ARAVE|nr:hypothetical protein AVEN_275508-1 [Araneus ventricosus]
MDPSDHIKIKIVQINLHHAIAAIKTLKERAKDQKIAIACVQELYEIEHRPVGIPGHCKLFCTTREKLKAGIIVFDPSLQAMKVFSASNVLGMTFNGAARSFCCYQSTVHPRRT